MTGNVYQITDKPSHEAIVSAAEAGASTVIYVSNSSLPACKTFTPKYEALADGYANHGIKFCQLDFTNLTSMMFKFAPNQLPVLVLMGMEMTGRLWAKTIMGAELRQLEMGVEELLTRTGKADVGTNGHAK